MVTLPIPAHNEFELGLIDIAPRPFSALMHNLLFFSSS